jgi:peptidoglycan/LPS O-acetylase OafA/YrhL
MPLEPTIRARKDIFMIADAITIETKNKQTARNKAIQGLRGFSAGIVVISHIYEVSTKPIVGFVHPFSSASLDMAVRNLGKFGVTLFFFISGYLIVQSLIKHANIGEFLRNRVARIYPVFFILLLVVFALGPASNYEWMGSLRHSPSLFAANFLSNLFFLPGIFSLPIAQKNSWTLSYEFLFYLTACIFYFGFTMRSKKPAAGYAAIFVGLCITAATIYFRFLAIFFLVGVFVYFYFDRLNSVFHYAKWQQLNGFILVIASYLAVLYWLPGLLILGPLLFFQVVKEEGLFPRMLRAPLFQHLGLISYSLYLIHSFVLELLRRLADHLRHHIHSHATLLILFATIGIAVSVYVSTLSYRWIEVKLSKAIFGRRPAVGGPPVPSQRRTV